MLITLVIVGVVAALTLPTLMTKYQQHVFANQFKKSLYTISQIVANTRSELGVSKLANYCTEYDTNKGGYYNANECGDAINKNLRKTSTKKQSRFFHGGLADTDRHDTIKTYNNKADFTNFDSNVHSMFRINQLTDGSFLGFNVNSWNLFFSVDLNGYKKPNRLGYDIFIFSLNIQNDAIAPFLNRTPTNVSDEEAANYAENLGDNNYANYVEQTYGTPCNLESTRSGNGLGCAYYALRNKCPYDDTKTYWECLK